MVKMNKLIDKANELYDEYNLVTEQYKKLEKEIENHPLTKELNKCREKERRICSEASSVHSELVSLIEKIISDIDIPNNLEIEKTTIREGIKEVRYYFDMPFYEEFVCSIKDILPIRKIKKISKIFDKDWSTWNYKDYMKHHKIWQIGCNLFSHYIPKNFNIINLAFFATPKYSKKKKKEAYEIGIDIFSKVLNESGFKPKIFIQYYDNIQVSEDKIKSGDFLIDNPNLYKRILQKDTDTIFEIVKEYEKFLIQKYKEYKHKK